jgi:hypothetical protein
MILTPGSLLLTPALQEMKVHPEMLLKTKEGKKEVVRYQVAGRGHEFESLKTSAAGTLFWLLTPGSWLLASGS